MVGESTTASGSRDWRRRGRAPRARAPRLIRGTQWVAIGAALRIAFVGAPLEIASLRWVALALALSLAVLVVSIALIGGVRLREPGRGRKAPETETFPWASWQLWQVASGVLALGLAVWSLEGALAGAARAPGASAPALIILWQTWAVTAFITAGAIQIVLGLVECAWVLRRRKQGRGRGPAGERPLR